MAQSTLATIIKNASNIDAVLDDDIGSGERKRIRAATYGDVEAALYKWFVDARAKNVPLNGLILLAQAKLLGFALGHENFNPGNGWLQRFKDRHGITCKSIVGEAAFVDKDGLQRWIVKHRSRILETYTERDICNAHETGLFFQLLPAKTLAAKTDECVGGKNSKNRITVLVCANMDGSDKRPLLVIGKPKKPRGFAKVLSMPVTYTHNTKAWMTGEIFRKWLTDFDKEMSAKKRKVLLLLDNCSAHHVNAHPSAVEPLLIDIRTADNAADLKVLLVKAVFFASGAWRDVKSETTLHCFEKAGFSRGSSAAEEITAEADIDAAAADGATAVTSLGQLWEAAGNASLVPSGLDYLDLDLADQDLVAA
ncbi:tigger transposable element-derived protein 6 [Dermacentor silvarum]|uniref:tigger transposable element-derived protein 6 n=1 Tax=Dermacentor silvarum TaxID=543639 RepID=UPI001897DDBD|nr:tigger transposable element-derived protein 6 [Dermacentor silvarum]